MDARALRYFQAVVEFGSYSRASEYLRISQPAISRQVDRLEKELGKALFVRSGIGAAPTDAGRLLFERSQPILRQLEEAAAEIKSVAGGSTGTIVIAIPPGVGHFLLPSLVERYQRLFPNISLKIISGIQRHHPRGAGARPRRRRLPARAAAAKRLQGHPAAGRGGLPGRQARHLAENAARDRTSRPPTCSACR